MTMAPLPPECLTSLLWLLVSGFLMDFGGVLPLTSGPLRTYTLLMLIINPLTAVCRLFLYFHQLDRQRSRQVTLASLKSGIVGAIAVWAALNAYGIGEQSGKNWPRGVLTGVMMLWCGSLMLGAWMQPTTEAASVCFQGDCPSRVQTAVAQTGGETGLIVTVTRCSKYGVCIVKNWTNVVRRLLSIWQWLRHCLVLHRMSLWDG